MTPLHPEDIGTANGFYLRFRGFELRDSEWFTGCHPIDGNKSYREDRDECWNGG